MICLGSDLDKADAWLGVWISETWKGVSVNDSWDAYGWGFH